MTGQFTVDEQAVIARNPAALRQLAWWHNHRSGQVDTTAKCQYHEIRMGELLQLAEKLKRK